MTQFKDKAGSQRDLVSAGLFFYPVLQAADVLAYRANEVPVGEDQRQHVELMRDVAERFNARFGETLVVPEIRVPAVGARIMDLQVPDKKMSTTGGSPQGTVLVLDEPDVIVKKFRSAVTDSGSEVVRGPDKAGISNLIDILAAVRGHLSRARSNRRSMDRATGRSSRRSPTRSSSTSRPCGSATRSFARTSRRSSGSWPRAPRRPTRSPPTPCSTSARRWASDRSGRGKAPPSGAADDPKAPPSGAADHPEAPPSGAADPQSQ